MNKSGKAFLETFFVFLFWYSICRTKDERDCFEANFSLEVNVTRTVEFYDVVPTDLRMNSVYYKIYCLACNSILASIIPLLSLFYLNIRTIMGKVTFTNFNKNLKSAKNYAVIHPIFQLFRKWRKIWKLPLKIRLENQMNKRHQKIKFTCIKDDVVAFCIVVENQCKSFFITHTIPKV